MDELYLEKSTKFSGQVELPNSKSLSIRALVLKYISGFKDLKIKGLVNCEDVNYCKQAIEDVENGKKEVYLGNSGLSYRSLVSAFAMKDIDVVMNCSEEMKRRPIRNLVDGLKEIGYNVKYLDNEGYPRLKTGLSVNVICNSVRIKGNVSSQYISSLLMIAPINGLEINIESNENISSTPYIEMTIALLKKFGIEVGYDRNYTFFKVEKQEFKNPGEIVVESDLTQMGYFIIGKMINHVSYSYLIDIYEKYRNKHINFPVGSPEWCACIGCSPRTNDEFKPYMGFDWKPDIMPVMIKHNINYYYNDMDYYSYVNKSMTFDTKQGDYKFIDLCNMLNHHTSRLINEHIHSRIFEVNPIFEHSFDNTINVDVKNIPDIGMTLCILALFAKNKTHYISGVESWKVKECDRLQAMKNELEKFGAIVDITDNTITIQSPDKLKDNVVVETYNDHRMAMCFSLVTLGINGVNVTIKNPDCVNKTYPNYWNDFKKLTGR